MPAYSLIAVLAVIYGMILGSFFNVLICRVPGNKSILRPASHCPRCGTPLKPWHNIPVVSYLFLRGRCAFCKKPISPVYPVVELITGAMALLLWILYIAPQLPAARPRIICLAFESLFLLFMIPVTVIDFRHYIIPDRLTLTFLAVAAGISFLPGTRTPLSSLFGILAGGGSLLLVGIIGTALLKKDAMGGGDIKLMAAAGAFWGAQTVLLSIIFGALVGALYGMALLATRRINSEHQIPFGPFLGAGTWLAVLYGEDILNWYMTGIDKLTGG